MENKSNSSLKSLEYPESFVDVSSEAATLGSMILDRENVPIIRNILRDEFYFSKSEHRHIFNGIIKVYESGSDKIDLLLVRSELEAMDRLKAAGGVDYLVQVADSTPTSANAVYYAQKVLDKYRLRMAWQHTQNQQGILKSGRNWADTQRDLQQDKKDFLDGFPADSGNYNVLPLIRLSDIEAHPISWLWDNKFPNNGLNLLAGMGEAGKTTFASYLMGRITTGQDWIDCKNTTPAGTCLFFGNEDALENSIRPKLDATGADPSKVVALNYNTFFQQGKTFNLVEHIEFLDNTIKSIGDVRAVFFDPLNGYVGKVNSNNDCEARSVLIPLQNIATKYGITIFGLCHLNKKSDLAAIDRVMGSVAFVNTARSVWFITYDKEKDIRNLTKEKANYCINPTNLTFRIIDNAVSFIGTTEQTADDILQSGRQKSDSTVECTEWLQKKLQYNSSLATDIKEQAEIEGFSRYALDEAKRSLRVVSKRDGFGGNGKWRLSLPEQGGKDA